MKNIFILFFFFLFPTIAYSQDTFDFTGLQGIKSGNEDIYFEFRGYEIFTTSVSAGLATLTSNEIVSEEIQLGRILADYNEAVGNIYCRIIESEEPLGYGVEENINQALYLTNKLGGEVVIVQFKTCNQRDFVLERAFVHAFFEKQLNSYVLDSRTANTIDFIGQEILLGDECIWTKPHMVTCGDAQISWSEFLSIEEAVLDIDNRIRIYDTDNFIIVEEKDIEVVFEGTPTIARRIVFRNVREMDEPYKISYYLAQEVGGRYVSCVLTNPAYNQKEYGLASLLQQVMSIPNVPEDAYVAEEIDYIKSSDDDSFAPELEIQAGSWIPVGQLSDVFGYAPTLGLVLKFPLKHEFSIGLGIQLGLPLNKEKFEYKMDNRYYETQSDFLFGASLRCTKSKTFSKEYRFSTYLGIGINGLQTDVEKWNYEEEKEEIQSVSTVDIFGGASLQYKKVSIFAEYHYTPYNMQSKVGSHFGQSALNIGLAYSIICK